MKGYFQPSYIQRCSLRYSRTITGTLVGGIYNTEHKEFFFYSKGCKPKILLSNSDHCDVKNQQSANK